MSEAEADWTFAGRAAGEPMEAWLDRVHPVSYDADDGPFLRCPTCEEWSPCDVRTGIVALFADPTPAPPAGPVLGEEARAALIEAHLPSSFELMSDGYTSMCVRSEAEAADVALTTLAPHVAALVATARVDERIRVLRDVVGHLDRNGLRGEETAYISHLLAAAERTQQ